MLNASMTLFYRFIGLMADPLELSSNALIESGNHILVYCEVIALQGEHIISLRVSGFWLLAFWLIYRLLWRRGLVRYEAVGS